MTAEWFDLGQRFRAATTGAPVARLSHAPIAATPHPVAVRAHLSGSLVTVTACAPDTPASCSTGPHALALLASLGVTITASSPATLVTDTATTLPLLRRLALTASRSTAEDDTAAHIAWWLDRADFPGGRAVVETPDACRLRWVTGRAPAAETNPAAWRHWLDVSDDGVAGLLTLYQRLTAGPALPHLSVLSEDDTWAFGAAQNQHADGWDWRRPDATSRAALGLRSRCDAADLYADALLADPLYRARAVHTGHVVTGTADPLGDRLKRTHLTCTRLDARLRPGSEVTGWIGAPTDSAPHFSATVIAAEVEHGHLTLTLSGVTGPAPVSGQQATIHATGPSPYRQRAGRKSYRALYAARRSWLTTGRTPTPTRRDVPLDVLVAGADAD